MWFRIRSKRAQESPPTREAREGAQRAEAELDRVRGQRPLVASLAAFIDRRIEVNHFGESIERAIELRKAAHDYP